MTDRHWISKKRDFACPECMHANYTQIKGKHAKTQRKPLSEV